LRNTHPDTVILLFAHAAAHEARSKTFSPWQGAHVNKKVAKALLRHTLAVIRKSGIPLFTSYTDQQRGNSFGERLANAFQEVFDAGYQRVICVGSDCPALTSVDLLQARGTLQEQQMVVGPAADGGAYLIGLHVGCFDLKAFSRLSWQTEQVLQELSVYAVNMQACTQEVALLQERADVDSEEDLNLMLQQIPVLSKLRRLILAILSEATANKHKLRNLLLRPLEQHLQELPLRAPPRYF
jgi:glycosyltransferase A (GT-A) superfamily protein (DUF2064 family)